MTDRSSDSGQTRIGVFYALGAAVLWGIVPIYFKQLDSIGAVAIVAHRIIWSVPLLIVVMALRGRLCEIARALKVRRTRNFLFLSAGLITGNWLVYVWAVNHGHVLAASLGYFLNPLLNVMLAMLVLKERLTRLQWIAVGIAAAGVAILAVQALQFLWISVALAGFWGCYSLVRKVAEVGPIAGLAIETSILAPVALAFFAWLTWSGSGTVFAPEAGVNAMLVGSAVVTALPLLLFIGASKKLSFVTLGLIQYVAPTLQFLVGAFLYDEPLTASALTCFALIWVSLAVFSYDAWSKSRAPVSMTV